MRTLAGSPLRPLALFVLALLWQAAHLAAAISQVEVVAAASNGAGSVAITLGTATTAGELITVHVGTGEASGASPGSTVVDNLGSSYATAWSDHIAYQYNDELFYLANAPSGITSLTITLNNGIVFGGAIVGHYKGAATTAPLDVSSSPTAGSPLASWSSGSVTTTQANELLVGTVIGVPATGSMTLAAGGSWTLDGTLSSADFDGGNGNELANSYQIVSTIQTGIGSAWTDSTGTAYNCAGIATFKAAASTAKACTLSLLGTGPC
jgi:hypothetical protein